MKILKIRFKNIHSFKGEHELQFDVPPLSNAGLFAITGPTGAGKSTLLDVITLALYNNIPRFDSKITKNDIEKYGSVLTHHATDAYAEVDYEAGGRRYRSTWTVARTKNQTLKDYEMSLATLPDRNFEDLKKTEVPQRNEEIIGLKYDQFVRSIILSQGDFARFLKSKEDERASLLEDLTGADIYRKIGKAAYRKAKESKSEIELLKREIDSFKLLEEDTVKQLQEQIESGRSASDKLQIQITDKQATLSTINEYHIQKNLLEARKADLQEFLKRKAAFHENEIRLINHRNLLPYKSDLLILKENIAKLEKSDLLFKETVIQYENAVMSCSELNQKINKLTGKQVEESEVHLTLSEFSANVSKLDYELNQLSESGRNFRKKLKIKTGELEPEMSKFLNDNKNPENQLKFVREKLDTIENRVLKDGKKDERELLKQLEFQKTKTDLLQEQLTFSESKLKLEEKLHQSEGKIKKLKEEIVKNEYLIHQCTNEIETLSKEINILQKEKEQQVKLNSLEDHRSALVSGEPCPLCGSTNHPYVIHKVINDFVKTQLELDAKVSLKINKESVHRQLISSKSESIGSIQTVQQLVETTKSEIHVISEKISNEYKDFSSTEISEQLSQSKQKLQSIQSDILNLHNFRILSEAKKILIELSGVLLKYKETEAERKQLYSGTDVIAECKTLAREWAEVQKNKLALNTTVELQKQDNEVLRKSSENIEVKLSQNLSVIGYPDVGSALKILLDDHEWQRLSDEKSLLEQESERINTSILTIENKLQELVKDETIELDTTALNGEINEMIQIRDQLHQTVGSINNQLKENENKILLLKDKQNHLLKLENEGKKWILLDHFIGDSEGKNFAKFAQQISLRYLLNIANKRLTELTDRYMLATDTIQSEFLEVIDTYLGNTRRSVRTLSGGETFIVSLALALSLSDMASRNVKLESLFIDEGFGTLDPETLESALITLEKLQSNSSKTIGIISHVESLKERIYTQVKVLRNNRGFSRLEVG